MEVLDKAKAVFSRYAIEPEEQEGQLRTFMRTGLIGSRLRVIHTKKFLTVKIEIPIFAPIYKSAAMAEVACRANQNLVMGKFEYDIAGGSELRFSSSMPLLDGDVSEEQLDCLIFMSVSIVEHFADAFLEVAVGMLEPAVAIEKAEANWQEKIRNAGVAED